MRWVTLLADFLCYGCRWGYACRRDYAFGNNNIFMTQFTMLMILCNTFYLEFQSTLPQ